MFNYEIPSKQTGECWGISAHPNGPCEILNGPLKGKTLDQAWKDHRELFGNLDMEEFPLLIKILDANRDLSIQVHPNDEYTRLVENEQYGKTECWYIIDCQEDAEIIYGHHAKSKEEFQRMASKGRWDELFRRVKVKPGEFYYVPSGTIHAIGKGIVILETQQSSDITYRLYDYDRRDQNGNIRELHIEKSIEVAMIPHRDSQMEHEQTKAEGLTSKKLIKEQYFTVYHWDLDGSFTGEMNQKFMLVSVISGSGEISITNNKVEFKKGDHFIIPSTINAYQIRGLASFIVSHS